MSIIHLFNCISTPTSCLCFSYSCFTAISEAEDEDKDQAMQSLDEFVEKSNQGNTLLSDEERTASKVGRTAGLTAIVETEKIKPKDKNSNEKIKIRKNKIRMGTPINPLTEMPFEASCDDWQGETYAKAPTGADKYRIKLTHVPVLCYDKSHRMDVDSTGNQKYYESTRHYMFASIPVGEKADTGKTPTKNNVTVDHTTALDRQKAVIAAKKRKAAGGGP